MKLQRQPNRWSCLPTSFAMAMNIPLDDVLRAIEHDGSEILYPELPEPIRRRGFHPQELIGITEHFGYVTTQFEAYPMLKHADEERLVWPKTHSELRFLKYMQNTNGVLMGLYNHERGHAVAWDHTTENVYNPVGTIHKLDKIRIQHFLSLYKL